MIYEIFKQSLESSFSWVNWACAVMVVTYALYILGWIVSGVYGWSYSFVFEGKKTTPNFMMSFIKRLGGGKDLHLLKKGWYRSKDIGQPTYYSFTKIIKGVVISRSDKVDNFLLPPRDQMPILFFGYWAHEAIIILCPLVFSLIFLLIDRFPGVSSIIGCYWGFLLLARKAVKLGEKISSHIEDKTIHNKVTL